MLKRVFVLFTLVMLLASCATKRVVVKPDVFENRKYTIGVAIAQPPEIGIAQYGGWLAFFNPMTNKHSREKQMLDFFKTVDLSAFDTVADEFVKRLKAKKIKAKRVPDYIALNDFKRIGNTYDFSSLVKEEKIDALILLSIASFGTWNNYILVYPVGSQKVFLQPLGYMVNFKENGTAVVVGDDPIDKKWLFTRAYMQDSVAVDDWDQPPMYNNMNKALDGLINTVTKLLIDDFFEQKEVVSDTRRD